MQPAFRPHRPLIMGRNGAVGANHPAAAQAGLDTLRAGGNAADAAVATALALGVCEPAMSGLGGDGFYHLHRAPTPTAPDGAAIVYNGTGPAPAAATPESYAAGIPVDGPRSVSVPGMLGALAAMHAEHGRLHWADLVRPAVALAEHGFAATATFRHFAAENPARLAADERSAATFADKALADLVRQPALARTLEAIAAGGAETFYRGPLAVRLAAAFRATGIAITEADLAAFQPERTAPIAVRYRGFEVRQTPPNSTGFTLLQMLKTVERFDLAALTPADRIHVLVEAKKLAFQDRERHGQDPRHGTVPLDHLLSDAHADAQAARIDRRTAAARPLQAPAEAADTTYFCVVDADGNAVSAIQSINSAFGSGVTAGDTGVLMNNRMAYWHLQPGHPNRLRPGKRVRHTMNAPMVFKDGRLWAVLGTPGADNQVQVNLQVLTAMIDGGDDAQTALERPRWTSSQPNQAANYPHTADNRLTIEADVGEDTLAALRALGHDLAVVPHGAGPCAMQAIRLMPNGIRAAASDTRRDGWAAAY